MDPPYTQAVERDCAHPPPRAASAFKAQAALRPPQIRITTPDGSTLALPGMSWPQTALWRACAQTAGRGEQPPLVVREITRQETRALVARWDGRSAPRLSFGARSIALFLRTRPLALLTAANASEPVVDQTLGLLRCNCIELSLLAAASEPAESGADRLLARIWRERLALWDWPYYPQVRKVALVCYPTRAGATRALSAAEGWEPVPPTSRHGLALSVCWLDRRPSDTLAAFPGAPPRRRAMARAA